MDPLVAHLKAMLNYRKFRRGTKTEVDELLRMEKAENPMRIVYGFGISHEHPGTFILTYIRSSNPHHEYIGVYPKGFKFRKRMFEDIDRLVAYFQRHIDDPHDSGPSIRSVAAMVPMRSPAPGGSSGFGGGWGSSSNDAGWRGGQSMDRDRGSGSRTGETDDSIHTSCIYRVCIFGPSPILALSFLCISCYSLSSYLILVTGNDVSNVKYGGGLVSHCIFIC